MKAPDDTEPTVALASWLAGHCQAMGGGNKEPAPSIEDVDNWMLGYDVGTRDRQEGEDSLPSCHTA
jgi:hypothetical protein